MPELIEAEIYRQQADAVVGRRITAAPVVDDLGRARDSDPDVFRAAVVGASVIATRRIGKLVLLDTDGPTIGIRFGMTGRLIVDGEASIEALEYSSTRDEPAWDRFVLDFDTGSMVLRDPRRLGGMELDPDESVLGPDAASITTAELRAALLGSRAPLKARLLDQHRVAGLGNLLVDETLWRAGISPAASSGGLVEVQTLAQAIRSTIKTLTKRGGSHTGDLHEARAPGTSCPRDGAPIRRDTIGGRTTYWCPSHQLAS